MPVVSIIHPKVDFLQLIKVAATQSSWFPFRIYLSLSLPLSLRLCGAIVKNTAVLSQSVRARSLYTQSLFLIQLLAQSLYSNHALLLASSLHLSSSPWSEKPCILLSPPPPPPLCSSIAVPGSLYHTESTCCKAGDHKSSATCSRTLETGQGCLPGLRTSVGNAASAGMQIFLGPPLST